MREREIYFFNDELDSCSSEIEWDGSDELRS